MFTLHPFLGFPTDDCFHQALVQVNPTVRTLFTGGGDYLSEFFHHGQHFLGKPLSATIPIQELEYVESHLLSILKALAPNYCFSKNPPVLVTTIQ